MSFWKRIGQRLGDLVEDVTVSDEVAELYRQAREAYEAGAYVDAALLAERVTRAADEHVRAWTLLGLAQLKRERLIDARSSFDRALTLRPDDHSTLAVLAQTQHRLGDDVAAIASCKRALVGKVDAELLDDFYGLLGEVFLGRGELDRAVRELRKAVAASAGKDLRLVGLLGRALAEDRPLLAAPHLRAAAAAPTPDPLVLSALVDVLLANGDAREARLAAQRLLELDPRDAEARCLLARAQLEGGEPVEARDTLLRALELDASLAQAHRLLGRAHAAVGNMQLAVEHLDVALQRAEDAERPTLLREQLELHFAALPAPGPESDPTEVAYADLAEGAHEPLEQALEALGEVAETLLEQHPNDALALAGAALAARDDPNRAMQLAARSLAAGETYEGRLTLALLFERGGQPQAAITALRSALRLRPAAPVARQLVRVAYRKHLGLEARAPGAGLYPTFARVESLLASQPETAPFAPAARRIRQDFDRPLLIAVMGEFNTGKSTFVNALIGEEIAPMGITPTTATINVLKYGEERAARVIWADDREELLPWEQVGGFLRGLDHEKARKVRFVELLEPHEALLRVNVVDTPGLNSIVDEHEQTAREFIEQADAVVWLFAADQAGKQTEEEALEILQRQRLKTIGVVNKVDRLSPTEIERVVAHLDESFGELVEKILPVSAKRALRGRVTGDEAMLAESRFPELRAFLEERLFSRSRRIKREAAQRKLGELIATARQAVDASLDPRAASRERLTEQREALAESWNSEARLDEERLALRQALERVYRRGADEVLDFVRPRRWRLGNHRAEPADRDFLLELLTDGLRHVAEDSRSRVGEQLDRHRAQLLAGIGSTAALGSTATLGSKGQSSRTDDETSTLAIERVVDAQHDLLAQQVYARFIAFARGFLSGGRIDDFFARQIPDLDLDVDAIFELLAADLATFESELIDPLRQWDSACAGALRRALLERESALALEELELEAAARDPLLQLEAELTRAG